MEISIITDYILYFIIITLIFYIIYKRYKFYINSVQVRSPIDNKYYYVRDTKNKQQSADTLAQINKNILLLINFLKKETNKNKNVELLINRYSNRLLENIDLENTTYTVNKGEEIAVCLYKRDNDDNIYDINKLMFVIIHELAHIGCESYGHNNEFKTFFIYLLKKAIEVKIYKYEDYSKQPTEYCGMIINTSPI